MILKIAYLGSVIVLCLPDIEFCGPFSISDARFVESPRSRSIPNVSVLLQALRAGGRLPFELVPRPIIVPKSTCK